MPQFCLAAWFCLIWGISTCRPQTGKTQTGKISRAYRSEIATTAIATPTGRKIASRNCNAIRKHADSRIATTKTPTPTEN
jgi:hypothetical protein